MITSERAANARRRRTLLLLELGDSDPDRRFRREHADLVRKRRDLARRFGRGRVRTADNPADLAELYRRRGFRSFGIGSTFTK